MLVTALLVLWLASRPGVLGIHQTGVASRPGVIGLQQNALVAPSSSYFQCPAILREQLLSTTKEAESGIQPLKEGEVRDRVAICLIGGARHFELTGPSLHRNLLSVYPRADLFFVVNPDKNAYKLSMLTWPVTDKETRSSHAPRLVYFNMSRQKIILESKYPTHLIKVPHLQGQLQQFLKLEVCANAISSAETAQGALYDWIIWTRLDTYWHAPPPPLSDLDSLVYHLPSGFSWGGYNDRFGLGARDLVMPALRRLSSLRHVGKYLKISNIPCVGFNSEKLLKLQLEMLGIPVKLIPLEFCVLTFARRKYPIGSLWGPQAVNGTSCRPCARHENGFCIQQGENRFGWKDAFRQGAPPGDRKAWDAFSEERSKERCRNDWRKFSSSFCIWKDISGFNVCK